MAKRMLSVVDLATTQLAEHLGVGLEKVQGLAELIDPSWINPVRHEPGNMTSEAWTARKMKFGGGRSEPALEVVPTNYKSENVSTFRCRHGLGYLSKRASRCFVSKRSSISY
jgi:hypothetical protein